MSSVFFDVCLFGLFFFRWTADHEHMTAIGKRGSEDIVASAI